MVGIENCIDECLKHEDCDGFVLRRNSEQICGYWKQKPFDFNLRFDTESWHDKELKHRCYEKIEIPSLIITLQGPKHEVNGVVTIIMKNETLLLNTEEELILLPEEIEIEILKLKSGSGTSVEDVFDYIMLIIILCGIAVGIWYCIIFIGYWIHNCCKRIMDCENFYCTGPSCCTTMSIMNCQNF